MNYYLVNDEGEDFIVRVEKELFAYSTVRLDMHNEIVTVGAVEINDNPLKPKELVEWLEKAEMTPEEIIETLKSEKQEVVIAPSHYE